MKWISVPLVLLLTLLLSQSCIKEDAPDCATSLLRLKYQYTLNKHYSDLFGQEVRVVTAYIFDAEGMYVGSYSEAGDPLARSYTMTIPLPEGAYQAVVFCDNLKTFAAGEMDNRTNSFSKELRPGATTVADFRLALNSAEGTGGYLKPASVPGDLYAGYVPHALSTYDPGDLSYVDLMKDTKNIQVKIYGMDLLTRSVPAPEIYITATNGRYKYDNSLDTSHRMLKYTPHATSTTGNTMVSDLRTMRLVTGHAPMLVIDFHTASGYVFKRDITELILSTPKYASQEDIDREDTFIFEINAGQAEDNTVISISVNGWEINTVAPVNN